MKTQVVVIHGGDAFGTYDEYIAFLKVHAVEGIEYFLKTRWRDHLQEDLGADYEVIAPKMPNKWNAKYEEWKIWFEKLLPFIRDGVILIGHSLGGTFLAKYLSENKFPVNIKASFLVCAPFDDADADYKLHDFSFSNNLKLLEERGGKIYIFHSKDDSVVPFTDFEKYRRALPNAEAIELDGCNHFEQDAFPELISLIQNI